VSTLDALGRPLRDLRVSVTDRCNFRCGYCMPREVFGADFAFVEREQLLTFEEIARLIKVFVRLGTRKVRLTGGEPLLRRDLNELVAMVRSVEGVDEVALTTNGSLLQQAASDLAAAGLGRIAVSIDAIDDATFRLMADTKVPVSVVLDGIEAARAAGLAVKLNAVIRRGMNEHAVLPLVRYGRERGLTVRFIEYMDVGSTNGWRLDEVVPAAELLAVIQSEHPVEPVEPAYRGEVANRYRYLDGSGEVGIIASVTQPFCGDCTRARLSATGELFLCLFASAGQDLRAPLRDGASDDELVDLLAASWRQRTDRYSEERAQGKRRPAKVEMSYIGG
jgi:GTP 3',8-cyclase